MFFSVQDSSTMSLCLLFNKYFHRKEISYLWQKFLFQCSKSRRVVLKITKKKKANFGEVYLFVLGGKVDHSTFLNFSFWFGVIFSGGDFF